MTEKGHFFCSICERRIDTDVSEVEKFRVGVKLLCPNCEKNLTISVVCKLRDDTSIPKTYRSIFRDYMKWRIKREEEGLS